MSAERPDKILERIIIGKFEEAISDDHRLDLSPRQLSPRQFGFRRGRSTIDALDSALSTIYRWTQRICI